MTKKIWLAILIPLLVAGLFSALNQLDFYKGAERGVYDLLLHVKPAVICRDSNVHGFLPTRRLQRPDSVFPPPISA